jgi:predicted peptidase
MKRILVFVALCAFVFATDSSFGEEKPGVQTATQLNTLVSVQLGYLVYLPKDYEKQSSWPLMLFLHGAGERGNDLELVKKHGPPKLIAAGKEFPFIVVSPQCPKDRWWEPFELVALINEISNRNKVDTDRIYVTGLSMGGFGSWSLAFFAPQQLAAIAPICGGGETHWTKQFSQLPVWAFHGAKDTVVPLERSQAMVDALKKNGGDPKLTVYPDAAHDSWTETYNNPAFYEWLLAQKQNVKK